MKTSLIVLVLAGLATHVLAAEAAKRPNLIVILADDIGAKELGCYGNPRAPHAATSTGWLQTGVKFETCFTSARLPSHAVHDHDRTIWLPSSAFTTFAANVAGPRRGDPHENIAIHVTFGHAAQASGLRDGLAGKWQLSGSQPTLIRECGFDEYCMWGFRRLLHRRGPRPGRGGGHRLPLALLASEHHSQRPSGCRPRTTTTAPTSINEFVARLHPPPHRTSPFFVYYPMCLTHSPWEPTPDYASHRRQRQEAGKRTSRRMSSTWTSLSATLVPTRSLGLRDNTVLFFTGDNGTGGDGKSQATELGRVCR